MLNYQRVLICLQFIKINRDLAKESRRERCKKKIHWKQNRWYLWTWNEVTADPPPQPISPRCLRFTFHLETLEIPSLHKARKFHTQSLFLRGRMAFLAQPQPRCPLQAHSSDRSWYVQKKKWLSILPSSAQASLKPAGYMGKLWKDWWNGTKPEEFYFHNVYLFAPQVIFALRRYMHKLEVRIQPYTECSPLPMPFPLEQVLSAENPLQGWTGATPFSDALLPLHLPPLSCPRTYDFSSRNASNDPAAPPGVRNGTISHLASNGKPFPSVFQFASQRLPLVSLKAIRGSVPIW